MHFRTSLLDVDCAMKHVGLVVTDTQLAEAVVRNYVLEFKVNDKNECTHALAQVGHAAFRFEPNGAFDQVYVKNQKRRLERPLSFGDVIEWDDADVTNKLISRIRRVPPLFETRIYDGRSQVLVSGVVSPSDKFLFWSQYFPRIEIDSASSNDVLPNVSVSAWLNIAVDADRKLCIEFDSFENVECETSIVAAAPWNRNGSKYTTLTIPINDDGLESQIEEPEMSSYDGGWKQELHNYEGICTGGRLIFCKKLPHHSIVVALIKNLKDSVPLDTGVSCEFSAVWNEYEKRFIVTHYKTKGRVLRLAMNGLVRWYCWRRYSRLASLLRVIIVQIKTSVKAVEDYPNVFKSDDFGLIDDPDGVLSLLHLSPYQRSSVVVSLLDSPSLLTRFRFRIVDVQPDKGPKLKRWMEENKVEVQNSKGIVIDASTIYSKEHGSIFFDVPETFRSIISPGKMVTFSAVYKHEDKSFEVSNISLLPNEIPCVERRMLSLPHEKQRLFRVSVKKIRRKELDCLVESEEFGLIDVDSYTYLTNKDIQRTVWVMRSLPDLQQTSRPSRTPFVVVWCGDREPPEKDSQAQNDAEVADRPQSVLEALSAINPENAMDAAMERMGISKTQPHKVECTEEACAPKCPHMEMIMLMIETVPQFLELLEKSDVALYTKVVNKMFM
ncbi:hypothetical protein Y032_0471g2057 [Ancylostoma ceylanicum]|uniref:Uncharacterized protein n=1 Tax=Ancylostoma ceylanicum TaxID=53326 RepID=A0A016WWV3_9BILA|nr:hypothetical protein Y032_0471g2057 [Ancylostoma ceylanicum]